MKRDKEIDLLKIEISNLQYDLYINHTNRELFECLDKLDVEELPIYVQE